MGALSRGIGSSSAKLHIPPRFEQQTEQTRVRRALDRFELIREVLEGDCDPRCVVQIICAFNDRAAARFPLLRDRQCKRAAACQLLRVQGHVQNSNIDPLWWTQSVLHAQNAPAHCRIVLVGSAEFELLARWDSLTSRRATMGIFRNDMVQPLPADFMADAQAWRSLVAHSRKMNTRGWGDVFRLLSMDLAQHLGMSGTVVGTPCALRRWGFHRHVRDVFISSSFISLVSSGGVVARLKNALHLWPQASVTLIVPNGRDTAFEALDLSAV